MAGPFSNMMKLQVIFLIVLQVTTLLVLWLVNPLTQKQTDNFALFLSIDLLAFALISYSYRSAKNRRDPNSLWMALGYLAVVVLLLANLLVI